MVPLPLGEDDLDADPLITFSAWFDAARAAGEPEPEAVALATASPEGVAAVRFVLLRGFDERGFVFYTNMQSRKGQELGINPRAALAFRWPRVDRQVRVAGPVAEVDPAESDEYFARRPRGHQLGAWASPQSSPISGRDELEQRLADVVERFEGTDVARPPWWGGYRVMATEVEFWQQRSDRLHDRFRFTRQPDGWSHLRLGP